MKSIIYKLLASNFISIIIGSLFKCKVPTIGGWIHVPESTSNKNKSSIILGIYEYAEKIMIKRHLKKNLSVIEGGASLGIITRCIQDKIFSNLKIVALEPNPYLQANLKKNVARKNHAKVFVEQAAFGNGNPSDFNVSIDNLKSSFQGSGETVKVETLRLQDILVKYNLKNFSIILDLEGYEHTLIAEEGSFLKSADTMIIEIHGDTDSIKDFIEKTQALGFEHVDCKHSTHVFKKKTHQ